MMAVVTDALDPAALTTQSIRASVIIADVDLRVLHIEGPLFIDHDDYPPADWPGQLLSEVLPAALMSDLEPRYRAALAGECQSFDYWSYDGRNAYWAQITPVRDGDGAVTSVVAVLQPLTLGLPLCRRVRCGVHEREATRPLQLDPRERVGAQKQQHDRQSRQHGEIGADTG